jgi:hypothetical protein
MHGLYSMKKALMRLGSKALDRRFTVGKALAKWRADISQDIGGDPSTQQVAIIDLAVKSKLLLDSIDAWLLTQPSLVNARKKSLLPVVSQRQQLADGFMRCLVRLELERKTKQLTLQELLEQDGDGDEGQP